MMYQERLKMLGLFILLERIFGGYLIAVLLHQMERESSYSKDRSRLCKGAQ